MSRLEPGGIPMTPHYEWNYVYPSYLLDDDNPDIRKLIPRGTILQLHMVMEHESYLVFSVPSNADTEIEKMALYSTNRLNEKLSESVHSPNGIQHALVAETLFQQQVIEGRVRDAGPLLDLRPPNHRNAAIHAILAPANGWLMWTWQLEALLMAAGCTSAFAKQMALAQRMHYPRTDRLLESLRIGDDTIRTVVDIGTKWGGIISNMHFPTHLIDAFQHSTQRHNLE